MNAKRLRDELLSAPDSTVLATCFFDGVLVGQAFATVWAFEGGALYVPI